MIRLSKIKEGDDIILVFDVRPKSICAERGTEPKVLLGKITPPEGNNREYLWESRWGYNRGFVPTLEDAQVTIEYCAKGMYV